MVPLLRFTHGSNLLAAAKSLPAQRTDYISREAMMILFRLLFHMLFSHFTAAALAADIYHLYAMPPGHFADTYRTMMIFADARSGTCRAELLISATDSWPAAFQHFSPISWGRISLRVLLSKFLVRIIHALL